MKPFQENAMGKDDKVEGEGSYSAAKDFDERAKKFMEKGKVEEAAREAAPQTPEEAEEMKRAEREGKRHAKGGGGPIENEPGKGHT
jgi:hypothetical protein